MFSADKCSMLSHWMFFIFCVAGTKHWVTSAQVKYLVRSVQLECSLSHWPLIGCTKPHLSWASHKLATVCRSQKLNSSHWSFIVIVSAHITLVFLTLLGSALAWKIFSACSVWECCCEWCYCTIHCPLYSYHAPEELRGNWLPHVIYLMRSPVQRL
jgi:hypothetical protein